MDGVEKRLSGSLQRRLSLAIALSILLTTVLAGMFAFGSAFSDAHTLQDDVLRQIAALAVRGRLTVDTQLRANGGDEDARVIVQRIGLAPTTATGIDAGGSLLLPNSLADGLQTLRSGDESFRVLVFTMPDGVRYGVAQESGFRDEIARTNALRTVLPLLLLGPVLLLLVTALLRHAWRPIAALARQIDHRVETDRSQLVLTDLPSEIRPFGSAINRLLQRVDRSLQQQRRFVADAAHELRSPLTALSLQAQALVRAEGSNQHTRDKLDTLRQGIERNRVLLDQLLTLARVQGADRASPDPVSLQKVLRTVLEDLMPLAEARQIDLSIDASGPDLLVRATATELAALMRNLLDNAIRYTQQGGCVVVAWQVDRNAAEISVRDDGPGIPDDERSRALDPFYRGARNTAPGCGLGLAIVKAVTDRLGAELRLAWADPSRRRGLLVSVHLPAGSATAA